MLTITLPEIEGYDEDSNEFFIMEEAQTLQLEHSLVSVSKWEAKWNKPFLTRSEKTPEETRDYIRCMTLTANVDQNVYYRLTNDLIENINCYITSPMTATIVREPKKGSTNEQVTSELIYYWMIALNIPFECQEWHLNRLLTLIKVCTAKNEPPKKMKKRDILSRNAQINAMRRQQLNSKG